jgi:hypothetical protein
MPCICKKIIQLQQYAQYIPTLALYIIRSNINLEHNVHTIRQITDRIAAPCPEEHLFHSSWDIQQQLRVYFYFLTCKFILFQKMPCCQHFPHLDGLLPADCSLARDPVVAPKPDATA